MSLFRRAGIRLQLIIDENTTPEELRKYLEERLQSKIILPDLDVEIYDFNNHTPNIEAIKTAISKFRENGINAKKFIIPYNRPDVWGYMLQYLPEDLKNAPILMPFKYLSTIIYHILYQGRFYNGLTYSHD